MSGEFCPQHSGLTTQMKIFNDRLTTLETKQDEGFKNILEKLDLMQKEQAQKDLVNAVNFATEKTENKWKHKISYMAYGFIGAGSFIGVQEAVTKIISKLGGG